jgi:decaprenylphospho-beta-D-ribofuranose 2-oxidase
MHTLPHAIAGLQGTVKKLGCWSGLYKEVPEVFEPENDHQLSDLFEYAVEHGCKITFRSGEHSFDSQSLNNDIVVSMRRFDKILSIDEGDDPQITVQPGATWGKIVQALKPLGLLPSVLVTTEHASAGGTLSGDCLSRFSCAYGKEGKHIRSFEFMKLDGTSLTCTPPAAGTSWDALTDEGEKIFRAAIGGLGYLGAVLSITYGVQRIGPPGTQMAIRTTATVFNTFDSLAEKLVDGTAEVAGATEPSFCDTSQRDALCSLLIVDGKGRRLAMVFDSTLTTTEWPGNSEHGRLLLNRPKLLIRIPIEWLLRIEWFNELALRLYCRHLSNKPEQSEVYVDDLEGFTFFMDGNDRAKRWGRRLGFKMQTIQQTFVVPSEDSPGVESRRRLVKWLRLTKAELWDRGLRPSMWDVLWLPKDEGFLLSASSASAGYAVSLAFETSSEAELESAREAFRALARLLNDYFGGRVYLVKNVHADPEVLGEMYGQDADRFFQFKLALDPEWTLQNDFLARIFPGYPKAPEAEPELIAELGPGMAPGGPVPAEEGAAQN